MKDNDARKRIDELEKEIKRLKSYNDNQKTETEYKLNPSKTEVIFCDNGNVLLQTFTEHRFIQVADYSNYGCWIDIPTGMLLNLIIIEIISGTPSISGLRIYFPKTSQYLEPIPTSILRTKPLDRPIYICFPQPIDLRMYQTGDLKLAMTLSGKTSEYQNEISINFGYKQKFLKLSHE